MADIQEEPKQSGVAASDVTRRIFGHENAILIIILVGIIGVLAVATRGASIAPGNVRNVLLQSSMRGIASVGQGFVLLCAYFDLSVGGLATMLTLLGATLLTEVPKHSLLGHPLAPAIGIPIMVLAGLGIGSVNGFSVSRLRMPALIVTLCMWQITNGIAYQIGRGWSVAGLPKSLAFFGQGQIAGIPVAVILFVAVAVSAYFVLNYTTFGRSVYAVGGNPTSAYLSGIRVGHIVFVVFVICGFLTALSSIIILSRYMSASMLVALGFELDTIAACIIGGVSLFGGRGTLIGIVMGVLIIGFLNNGMNIMGVPPPMQEVVKGSIIIGAVAVDTLRKG
jgi:ribose/xylose/arabinose/galactoside ABC-type transport system permease subunit